MFAHLEESTQYLLQEIFLFALQLSLFIMIPLLWYIVSHKKVRNFLAYIGIKKPLLNLEPDQIVRTVQKSP